MNPNRPLPQRTIGVLGGMSDTATAEYYRLLNAGINQRLGGWDIAETVIVGVNFGNVEHCIHNDDWDGLRDYLAERIERLMACDPDLVLCASNTVHRVVAGLMQPWPDRFIHIADPTGQALNAAEVRRVLLLGTRATMSSNYLRDYYTEHYGLELVVPTPAEQDDIDRIIFEELCRGQCLAPSKQRYLDIIDRHHAAGAEAIILGCTEIFLLIKQADRPDFPLFDSTQLHIEAAVARALAD